MHVTVLIPVYNRERYIGDAIDSVIAQDYSDWDILIVDDGSTDRTVEVVKAKMSDDRISLIQIKHGGCAAATAIGIEHARGPIITSLDSDDKLMPGALSAVIPSFEKNPRLGYVWTSYVDSTGEKGLSDFLPEKKTLLEAMVLGWERGFAERFFRKEFYLQSEGLDVSIKYSVDTQLALLIGKTGCDTLHIPKVTYWRRVHPHRIGVEHNAEQMEAWRLLRRKFASESVELSEQYIVELEKVISKCREQIEQLESSYALRLARRIPFGSQIRKLLSSKRSHETLICLTIDDGPSEKAGELLDYLMSKQIGAILFCRGDHLQAREELAVRAIHDGHIIGNHSYDHPHFSTLSKEQVRVQIARTDELLDQIYLKSGVQRPAKYFRFPYGDGGANNEAIETNQQLLREFGYWSPIHSPRRDWGWDVDVMDWRVEASNAAQKLGFAKETLKTLHSGAVLDLHDHSMNLEVGLFQSICDSISEMGFTFHTNKNLQDQIMKHHPLG